MIIRRKKNTPVEAVSEPRGFDAYDLLLGDIMRGERATMGKSLLDVERDIRIRASYIAAIENTDPDAFDTPGFIPGYVRSYARYLGMDADETFDLFCKESGFSVAHGMSAGASSIRKEDAPLRAPQRSGDPFVDPKTPFVPAREPMLSRVEPGAVGTVAVLIALIGGIGYGGWAVLNEVQRVQFAPVENTPSVLTDLDPLDGIGLAQLSDDPARLAGAPIQPRDDEALDRLYRPEALDVPVLVARDAPISTLDPADVGTLRPQLAATDSFDPVEAAIASVLNRPDAGAVPQVVEEAKPVVRIVAVRPAWIQVTSADGTQLFAETLSKGDTYEVPALEQAPRLRVGESGAVYFSIGDEHYGPVGPRGVVTKNVLLVADALTELFDVAEVSQDADLSRYVAELELAEPEQ